MNFVSKLKLQYYTTKLKLEMQKKINSALPLGSIIPFAGTKAKLPDTYLFCNGNEVSRTEYADLFNIIGTIYGEGDGSTTFNLPNLVGRVPVGSDDSDSSLQALGNSIGNKVHEHDQNTFYFDHNNATYIGISNRRKIRNQTEIWDQLYGTQIAVKDVAASTKRAATYITEDASSYQPSLVVNYIIKAKYDVQTVQDLNIYSLDEHRIGTWVDGKPLYRKCFRGVITPGRNVSHGINNLESVTSLYGTFADPTTSNAYPVPNARPMHPGVRDIGLWFNTTVIGFEIGSDFKDANSYSLVIEYTKTTD